MTTAKNAKSAEVFDLGGMMSPEAFKEGYERASDSLRSFADFQKDTMDALMESANVCARGVEKAASEQSAFVKETYDEGAAAAKAASTASSVQEAIEIQSEFGRAAIERQMSFATKLADHWSAVAREATDPLSKRYGDFVEMVQTYRP